MQGYLCLYVTVNPKPSPPRLLTSLPPAAALFGLGIASALIGVLAALVPTPDWSETLAAMLGIGVGIDYALLILTRHRAALTAVPSRARR